MKNKLTLASAILCLIMVVSEVDGQIRQRPDVSSRSSRKEKVDKPSALEKINPELLFGNLGFYNGLFISAKLNAGYKLSNRFTLGAGTKLFYNQYSVVGPDPSIFDLSGFLYGRAKIINELYFQAEYAITKYEKDPAGYNIRGIYENRKVNHPLFGVGYMSGSDKWRFGIQLMYIASESAQDLQGSVVEYWFGASYNF